MIARALQSIAAFVVFNDRNAGCSNYILRMLHIPLLLNDRQKIEPVYQRDGAQVLEMIDFAVVVHAPRKFSTYMIQHGWSLSQGKGTIFNVHLIENVELVWARSKRHDFVDHAALPFLENWVGAITKRFRRIPEGTYGPLHSCLSRIMGRLGHGGLVAGLLVGLKADEGDGGSVGDRAMLRMIDHFLSCANTQTPTRLFKILWDMVYSAIEWGGQMGGMILYRVRVKTSYTLSPTQLEQGKASTALVRNEIIKWGL